ncbi:hypothetical protein ACFX13_023228 [Malus domestica]
MIKPPIQSEKTLPSFKGITLCLFFLFLLPTSSGSSRQPLDRVECLIKIPAFTNKHKGEDLTLIDADGFDDLGLDEMVDAGFGHDGDSDRALDFLGVGHSSAATLELDVDREVLEGHDGASAGLLSDASVGFFLSLWSFDVILQKGKNGSKFFIN